ncbi:MAG: MoxR family ATPase [Bacteroidota bacterium]
MSTYIPSTELTKARQVAAFLNRPLLLAGEPGTGKTTFAEHIAETEGKDLFVFNTKSVSQAQDLFYTYDAVAHFAEKEKSAIEFITLQALGKAIVNAIGVDEVKRRLLNEETFNHQLFVLRKTKNCKAIVDGFLADCCGRAAVVLIDEIDKAPRDFPNDILNEIERLHFTIRELGLDFRLEKDDKIKKDKIFVLLTSNFEKNLPDAFLRRCMFFNIEFPDEKALVIIMQSHIPNIDTELLKKRIGEFQIIRKHDGISKRPATSEFIDCIKWMIHSGSFDKEIKSDKEALITLIKKNEDLKQLLNTRN